MNHAVGDRRHDDVAPLHGDPLVERGRLGLLAGGYAEQQGRRARGRTGALHERPAMVSSRSMSPSRR